MSKTHEYALMLNDTHCLNGGKCPVVQELSEKLREISERIKELEQFRRRRTLPGKELFRAENIRHIRKKSKLTQQELAYILEVNVATVLSVADCTYFASVDDQERFVSEVAEKVYCQRIRTVSSSG